MDSPQSCLIIFNITKKSNLGNLIRTANALGVAEVIIVGKRAFHKFGSFGTAGQTGKRHFYSLDEACTYPRPRLLHMRRQDHRPGGAGTVASVSRADGIYGRQRRLGPHAATNSPQCDQFVYIPQYGSGASLNVNVAAAIVLHNFAVWATFPENSRDGGKFIPRTPRDGLADMVDSRILMNQTQSHSEATWLHNSSSRCKTSASPTAKRSCCGISACRSTTAPRSASSAKTDRANRPC